MTTADADLRRRAEEWIAGDVDPAAQDELRALLAQPDLAATDLADRFAGALAFGTAGLRGVMGAGSNRMNRAVVVRTTWALAETLRESAAQGSPSGTRAVPHVIVGADARRNSDVFVEDVAAVLGGAGLRVTLFREPVPTPLVAFAVKHLGAAAGVVVTASHNPPEYNGYKVYGDDGAQIAPPFDERIARAIDRAPPARAITRGVTRGVTQGIPRPLVDALRDAGRVAVAGDDLATAYVAAIRATSDRLARRDRPQDRTIPIVYTPLHGVGHRLMSRVLREAGFTAVTTVPEQEKPDGAFPTVAFPNPEEPGTMDRALALAASVGARLVLANDPDADRLAVAVASLPPEKGLRVLTGNEVGILLGHALLSDAGARATKSAVVTSIVSSPCLKAIAADFGARCEETLTGFKWIERRTIELEREGYDVLLGYEEALGYCVGNAVRDKDGIAAGLIVAELAASLAAEGKTLLDALDAIAERWGVFASRQMSVPKSPTMMRALRSSPPKRIGDEPVVAITDYLAGGPLPPSDALAFHLALGARIVVRPSGTEPKAKVYFDLRAPVATAEPLMAARAHANGRLAELMQAMKDVLASLPGGA